MKATQIQKVVAESIAETMPSIVESILAKLGNEKVQNKQSVAVEENTDGEWVKNKYGILVRKDAVKKETVTEKKTQKKAPTKTKSEQIASDGDSNPDGLSDAKIKSMIKAKNQKTGRKDYTGEWAVAEGKRFVYLYRNETFNLPFLYNPTTEKLVFNKPEYTRMCKEKDF